MYNFISNIFQQFSIKDMNFKYHRTGLALVFFFICTVTLLYPNTTLVFSAEIAANNINVSPVMTSAMRDSDTQITVYFSENVQTNGSNPTDFTVTDCRGNTFAVSAQADGTANDTKIVLTVANMNLSIGDVTVKYTKTGSVISDFSGNDLASDNTGVVISATLLRVASAVQSGDDQKLDVSAQGINTYAVHFNADGTRMFVGDLINGEIYEYDLVTAYDLSTATYNGDAEKLVLSNSGLAGVKAQVRSMSFNNDGTKLFVLTSHPFDVVQEYSLTTAYDISTATYSGNGDVLSVGAVDGDPLAFTFNPDGSKLFYTGNSTDKVHTFDLSVAFDVSTGVDAGVAGQFDFSSNLTFAPSIKFNANGTRMILLGTDFAFQYTLSTAFDVSTANYDGDDNRFVASPFVAGRQMISLFFSPDETKMFLGLFNSGGVWRYDLNSVDQTAPELTSATKDSETQVTITLTEDVTMYGTNPTDFTITDGAGNTYTVSAITDGTVKDDKVILTVADLSTAIGDLKITYVNNNNEVADLSCNNLATDATGVTIDTDMAEPILASGTIDSNTQITLTLSEPVQTNAGNPTDFVVTDALGNTFAVSAQVDGTGLDNKIVLTVANLSQVVGNLKVTYVNGNNEISDFGGNNLATDATGITIERAFVTKWTVDVSDLEITIPTSGAGYNYAVDWGDGNTDAAQTAAATHTYAVAGTYTVSITGAFPAIFFNDFGDKLIITSVEQWGGIEWTSFRSAFSGCANLVINASDAPLLGAVTTLSRMFEKASSVNQSISHWDVSTITDMSFMFSSATVFNQALDNWDVSNVTTTRGMFANALAFNQPLNNWNVSKVINTQAMFATARVFNQDLNSWDVSNVTDMLSMFLNCDEFDGNITGWNVGKVTTMVSMFESASKFNQNISNWDVREVTSMEKTFRRASLFNQDLTGWNVAKVTNMKNMFISATAFNNDLSSWDIGQVTTMDNMFQTSGLSDDNYDNILIGWAAKTVQSNVPLGAIGANYCAGTNARQSLITDDGWTISDDGELCPPVMVSATRDNNTQTTVTFDQNVQTNGTNPTDFIVTDGGGNAYAVSAQADGTAGDTDIVLTVADLSSVLGDLTITYTNNNNEIRDSSTGARFTITDATGVIIDLDVTVPTLVSGTKDSNTQITLTMSETVQTNGTNSTDFVVTDGAGSTYIVSGQTDGIVKDNKIVLTVADLSAALGDLKVTYTNNNNEISDFGGNNLATDATGIIIDLDATAPTLVSGTKDTNTQITLTLSEKVQTDGTNPTDFIVTDGAGSTFVVSGQADGTAQDDKIVLTVADLSTAIGDLKVTYINNNMEISDFGGNNMATDATGVTIDLDNSAPTLVSGNKDSNTQITLTLSEQVQTNGGNPTDFMVADGIGAIFTVSTQADGTPKDSRIVLTVADLTVAVGDLKITYTNNNNEISDFGNNRLATDGTGVIIDTDATEPTLVSGVRDSNTQITITLSEQVQIAINDPGEFIVKDNNNIPFVVSGLADGTGNDTDLILTVADFSAAIGPLTVTYQPTGNSISDFGGNFMITDLTGVPVVLNVPPSVSSITVAGTPAGNATSVDFTVTFSELVTGVDLSDFTLDVSGVTASISGIAGSGASYTVSLTSVSGTGTISIDLKASGTGIQDDESVDIVAGFTTGAVHTVDTVDPFPAGFAGILDDSNQQDFVTNDNTLVFGANPFDVANAKLIRADDQNDLGDLADHTSDVYEFFLDGVSLGSVNFTTTFEGQTALTWLLDYRATVLDDGTYVVTMASTDVAGNTTAAVTTYAGTIIVDTSAPAAPTVDLAASSDLGASSTDDLTSDVTPTINGTAEADASVEVFVDGTSVGTTSADASGDWTITVASALTEGAKTVTAKATDLAGNTGVASAGLVVTIDLSLAISSTSPADNEVDVLPNANLTITFDKATFKGTGNIVIKQKSDDSTLETIDVSGSNVTINGAVVTIDPVDNILPPDTEFYVNIEAGAFENEAGAAFAGIADNTTWSFTIIAASVVSSVDVPNDKTFKIGDNLDFTVNMILPITITGTASIPITIGSTALNATQVGAVSNSSTIVFRYTVKEDELDADGIAIGAAMDLNGGTMKDAFDVDAILTLNNVASTAAVLVDGVKPTAIISSTAVALVNGVFSTTISYDEAVENFAITDLTVTNGTASNFASATAGKVWTVDITPTADGTVTLALAAGTATDVAGNDNKAATNLTREFDGTPPVVMSINRKDDSIIKTGDAEADYRVTFSEDVTGVDLSDLSLVLTGTAVGTLNSVTTVDASTYDVNITAISGEGTLGLNLGDDDSVLDPATNALAGTGASNGDFTGQVYTVNFVPTDISLSASTINENNALSATVAMLSTTDADGTDVHSYSLAAGAGDADNGSFIVDGLNLKANNVSFNFEDKDSYSIRVETDDGNGGVFQKAFTVTINDVNEVPFSLNLTNNTIDEADEAQDVGQFMSLDQDAGETFSYGLVAGTGDAHNNEFEISGTVLRTAGLINFEVGPTRDIRVRVTDSGGLTFEQVFTINIEEVVIEPLREYETNTPGAEVKNVFTPNGDGVNETWVIEDIKDNPVNEVKVYSQSGRLIFSKVNYQNDWDATFKGDPIPDGTYYYEINIYNGQKIIKGFLTIIRNR